MSLKIGDIITFEHTFTLEDVELFTEVSCDKGVHYTVRVSAIVKAAMP